MRHSLTGIDPERLDLGHRAADHLGSKAPGVTEHTDEQGATQVVCQCAARDLTVRTQEIDLGTHNRLTVGVIDDPRQHGLRLYVRRRGTACQRSQNDRETDERHGHYGARSCTYCAIPPLESAFTRRYKNSCPS